MEPRTQRIHDTVLIAAAFSACTIAYVDGLATWQPRDEAMYARMGVHLAREGYKTPSIRPPRHGVTLPPIRRKSPSKGATAQAISSIRFSEPTMYFQTR